MRAARAGGRAATRKHAGGEPAPRSTVRRDDPPRPLDQTGLTHLVGYAATRASLQLKKSFAREFGRLGLKAVEYAVLVLVANNDDLNQKQICAALELSAPNLAVLLDGLEARDLVQRVRSSADRRATLIRLTPAGRSLHRRAVRIAATIESDATRVLTEAERELLIELLQRVARMPPAARC